jgi:hypothetical protein
LTQYGSVVVQALATAASAFRQTLRQLGLEDAPELADSAAFGRRAALVAAADLIWRRHLGALLDTRQAQELLGVGTRQAVSDMVKRGRLLALPSGDGRLAYPAFQFGPTGRPYPVLPFVIGTLKEAGADPHTIASWFATPKALLEDASPAEWLRRGGDDAAVREAARRTAARLGR